MHTTKRPLSFLLAVLMIVSMFAAVPFTASAEDKVIGENVIFKLGDTIVLPGNGIYIKRNQYESAREVHVNGTVTRFESDGYTYTLEIEEWGISAYLDTFDYWEEMEQGLSVLGITFSGSGTESDPYMPKLAFGEVESTWAGEGEGTEASPWLIKDLNDLRTLSANVASGMTYSGKYFKLTTDIDCGSDNWETIGGADAKMFSGTFDGDGKTITYSIICSENDAPKGLFAEIGSAGTVKNLNVAGSIVNTAEYAGPAGGIAAYNSGLIENCYSAVDITKGCDRGTGGIAARNDEGATIRYCAASGTLTWTGGSDFYAYIGGITGENYNYNDEESEIKIRYVTNCAMLGDVLAQNAKDQYNYAGRLIGRQFDDTTSDDCYYLDTMTVTGVVNSDSVTAKTAEELKAIGQAAIDAGYTVYGLALGGSLSNPDQEAADAVIALINAIGTVEYTDACKAKIDAARDAYDALTDTQKELVINYTTLTDAEAAYKAAAAASVKDWQSVTIDDQIYVNFLLNEANHEGMKSITISYTNQDKEVVNTVTVDLNTLEKAGDFYKVPAVVAPAQIGDTVTVTIVEADDSTTTLNTSIAAYCNALIAGNYEQKYKDLAAATLEYGQAANDYFAGTGFYAANDFAGTDAAQAVVSAVANRASTLSLDENARGKIVSASFMALTKPEFRFYTNGLTEFRFYTNGLTDAEAAALNSKITVTGPADVKAKFVRNASSGAIMLEVTGIEAATMDQAVTITIDGFGTITFCGNDFARLLAKNTSTATLGAALYNYGVAAKACFTA